MIIIGIDPSLTVTACCILQSLPHSGPLLERVIPGKLRGMERLDYIQNSIRDILNRYSCDLVCIEGYAYARPNQAHQMGELGGVLRLLLYRENVPYTEIAPPTLKKFATGKGNADKDQVMLQVYKRWGIECANNNEADAFVLAKMGECLIMGKEELTVAQAEAMKKLKLPEIS